MIRLAPSVRAHLGTIAVTGISADAVVGISFSPAEPGVAADRVGRLGQADRQVAAGGRPQLPEVEPEP